MGLTLEELKTHLKQQEVSMINSMHNMLDEKLALRFNTLKEELKMAVKKDISEFSVELNQKIYEVDDKVYKLIDKVDDNWECEKRWPELKIIGIPKRAGENLTSILESVSSLLGYKPDEIPEATTFRIPGKDSTPIIITFASTMQKDGFLRRSFKAKDLLKVSKLPGFDSTETFKIRQNLTKTNGDINMKAQKMKWESKISKVRLDKGKVLIQLNDSSRFHLIHSVAELENLVPS